MAGTTPVTFENATTTHFAMGDDGRIIISGQDRGPRTVDMSAKALAALAVCSGGANTESGAGFNAKAEALAARDAATAENTQTTNPSTPGFKPVMKT